MDLAALRSAIIAFVLAVWVVMGVPVPLGLDEDDLEKKPRVRAEVARWSDTLADLGIEVPPEQLGPAFVGVVQPIVQARDTLLAPLKPLTKQLGLNQRWALYASPPQDPALMVIEGHDGESWRVLYRTLSTTETWRAHQFKYRRMRGNWSMLDKKGGRRLRVYADWVASQAFVDFPELERVRLRIVRRRTALPGEADGGAETEVRKRTVKRTSL